MLTFSNSARGLGLLVDMNWDRCLFIGAIAVALLASSQIGHFVIPEGF